MSAVPVSRSIGLRLAAAVAVAILAILTPTAAAAATGPPVADTRQAPAPADLQGLLDAFGVADQPIDFVVAVDTSGSMGAGPDPAYPKVVEAYRRFVEAIRPGDHLSTITFDTVSELRFNGDLDAADRSAALEALPLTAAGEHTDLGGALGATVDRLARPDAAAVEVLVVLTDGVHDPGPASPYPTTSGPAWVELAARAGGLGQGRTILTYGVGLEDGGRTDVELVRQVFPGAAVVSLPAEQLAPLFQEAVDQARIEQLRQPVTEELERGGVEVSAEPASELGPVVRYDLRLTATTEVLPVTVEVAGVVAADAAGMTVPAQLVDGPVTVTLEPGATSDPIPVDVETDVDLGGFRAGEEEVSGAYQIDLEARAWVEPADLLGRTLAVPADVPVRQVGGPVEVSGTRGLSWPTVILLGLLLVGILVLVALFVRWLSVPPRLKGTFELLDLDERVVANIPAKGRAWTFPDPRDADVKRLDAEPFNSLVLHAGSTRVEVFTKPRRRSPYLRRDRRHEGRVEVGTLARRSALSGEQVLTPNTIVQVGDLLARWRPGRLPAGPIEREEGHSDAASLSGGQP